MSTLRVQIFLTGNPGTFRAAKLDEALLFLGFFRVSRLEDLTKDATDDFWPSAIYEGRRKHHFEDVVFSAIQMQLFESGFKDAKLVMLHVQKAS